MNHMFPNILLIMTDQMRKDAVNLGQSECKHTPHLDALARTSIQFSCCVTTSPICAPARASLLSGLYPHQMGIWNNDPHTFPTDVKNWVKTLKGQGYRTSVFGKTHYYPYNGSVPDMREAEPLLHAYGYEEVDEIPGPRVSGTLLSHMTARWKAEGYLEMVRSDLARRYAGKHTCTEPSPLPLELYPDVYVGTKAIEYLSEYDHKKPFFCFVSFGGPHDPWDCPARYSERFASCTMETPRKPFKDLKMDRKRGVWDKELHHPPLDIGDLEQVRRNYAGKVSLIDEQIGRILDTLKKSGQWDQTIVIFTSDHGEMLGDYHRLYKQNFLGPSVEVPLFIKLPYQTTAQVCHSPVELIDLGPTIVEYAGTKLDFPQQGKSLRALCESKSEKVRDVVFSEYNREIMIHDGKWKMVVNKDKEPYLLFDLAHDPEEQLNVVGSYPRQERRLLSCIMKHLHDTDGEGFTHET